MRKKRPGFFALTYAVLLFLILIIRIVYVYTVCDRILPDWFVFYRFTYLTNYIVLAWLVVFSICCLSKKELNIEKILTKRCVSVSLALYTFLLFIYFIAGVIGGIIAFDGEGARLVFNILRRLFTYVFTPIVMWVCIFALKKNEIKKENKIKNSLIALIFPLVYFILNMVVGHTVYYGGGIRAFAYEVFDPSLYSWRLFVLGIALTAVLLFFVAVLINAIFEKIESKVVQ